MTGSPPSTGGAVNWLTAQSVVFGAMAALLGIVANAMFLDTYGSGWLPATYVAIGVAGIFVSGGVARTAERFDLVRIALVVLGAAAAGLGLAWLLALGGAVWVSIPLLVLFPILIQLGFVFIGGQAGRLLDITGIKASFPRIMTGFPVGAVLGGLLGGQLVGWLGRTEDLLLATALAQAAFAALVWVTGVRYVGQVAAPDTAPRGSARNDAGDDQHRPPSLRQSLTSRFVALILAYQVLSALGSQLADFLVFDRANAQYTDAADLAQFLAGYTAVMNVVSIAFLFILAGPLLRRFGLRLGIAANPVVLTVLAFGMIAADSLAGGGSLALLVVVSAARIADIALTDGTTRTSINATYQVLPERERLPVQAAVEGIGVPVAIGISGMLILLLNALPFALAATIGVTAILCVVWTWSGVLLFLEYGRALVAALRTRPLLAPTSALDATPADKAIARRLLVSPDARAARLGLDLLTTISAPALAIELKGLSADQRPDVRMSALTGLAAVGDAAARARLAADVRAALGGEDAAVRLRAARALEALDAADREAAASLLSDPDPAVRSAALDAVHEGDTFAVGSALAALESARTADAASGAIGRLGDAILPALAHALDTSGSPATPPVLRLVRAAATPSVGRDEILAHHVGHRDRELGRLVMERLAAREPANPDVAGELDAALADDARHAVRILAALAALGSGTGANRTPSEPSAPLQPDAPLQRALEDELDLVRRRVRAGRVARHGSARLGTVLVELGSGRSSSALAGEALEVLLASAESKVVGAILLADLPVPERLQRLPDAPADAPADADGWVRDLVADAGEHWRSAWLRACAVYAAQARGVLDQAGAASARALGDPIVDEALVRAKPRGRHGTQEPRPPA